MLVAFVITTARLGFALFGEQCYAGHVGRAVPRESGLRDRYFGESFADLARIIQASLALHTW
jgi:hypothetical protein